MTGPSSSPVAGSPRRSPHHSQTFPSISYRPQAFGLRFPTGWRRRPSRSCRGLVHPWKAHRTGCSDESVEPPAGYERNNQRRLIISRWDVNRLWRGCATGVGFRKAHASSPRVQGVNARCLNRQYPKQFGLGLARHPRMVPPRGCVRGTKTICHNTEARKPLRKPVRFRGRLTRLRAFRVAGVPHRTACFGQANALLDLVGQGSEPRQPA
jgi:hypothetical protein